MRSPKEALLTYLGEISFLHTTLRLVARSMLDLLDENDSLDSLLRAYYITRDKHFYHIFFEAESLATQSYSLPDEADLIMARVLHLMGEALLAKSIAASAALKD